MIERMIEWLSAMEKSIKAKEDSLALREHALSQHEKLCWVMVPSERHRCDSLDYFEQLPDDQPVWI